MDICQDGALYPTLMIQCAYNEIRPTTSLRIAFITGKDFFSFPKELAARSHATHSIRYRTAWRFMKKSDWEPGEL